MSSTLQVVLSDRSLLAREAARRFVALARDAIHAGGKFSVALSGGSTPRDLFVLLATPEFATQVDWARVHVFWGDERAVPPDHRDSNYRMANEALLARVAIPAQNVHRIRAELLPEEAAREYEQTVQEFFGRGLTVANCATATRTNADEEKNPRSSAVLRVPNFDLVLLGLGANGHTASLFPHTRLLHETQRWIAAEYIDEVKMWRITLTAPLINAAANILWLVAGADKAETVQQVLHGAYRPEDLPAQLIKPTHGNAVWLLDKDAASKLQIGD
ncbi:MAG: 6-phosphogluconolactonase [Chloroflexi bacterium]|nr:6-phosphogluconolactonase [Chloroflexota bacterium]